MSIEKSSESLEFPHFLRPFTAFRMILVVFFLFFEEKAL